MVGCMIQFIIPHSLQPPMRLVKVGVWSYIGLVLAENSTKDLGVGPSRYLLPSSLIKLGSVAAGALVPSTCYSSWSLLDSKYDFHNFLFSMKASNPLVMVQAYRLLAAEQYRCVGVNLGGSRDASLSPEPCLPLDVGPCRWDRRYRGTVGQV